MVHKSHEAVKEQSMGLKGKATAPDGGAGKIGHNSGTWKKLVDEYETLDERKKEIGKAQREIKAKLREQGAPTMPLNQVLKERKMETDVLTSFYQNTHIIRDALGMQTSLFDKMKFEDGQRGPTEAEITKAQGKGKPDPAEAAKAMASKK